jgi:2-polyprenyl-3-methyl-5-hydroxy-6-metoxy-1,4-benzoquinol methylase
MSEQQTHWQQIYEKKDPDQLTWYQPEATISLELIRQQKLSTESKLVDMGSGCSTLVDGLLASGLRHLTMVDLSSSALKCAQKRLGERSETIQWIAADATTWEPEEEYDLWHDRAVFHFLTTEGQREGYLKALRKGLKPGGRVVLSTFAVGGPEKCSGLPIVQYNAEKVRATFGEDFTLLLERTEEHPTPWGGHQSFAYFVLEYSPSGLSL